MDPFHAAHSFTPPPFDWAEPLICEQVLETYGQPNTCQGDLALVVAVHTKMWLSLISGDTDAFDAKQHDLARLVRQARLPLATIDRANRAVLLELILVVVTRFRNSDRVRLGYVKRLHAALRVVRAHPSYTLH